MLTMSKNGANQSSDKKVMVATRANGVSAETGVAQSRLAVFIDHPDKLDCLNKFRRRK